MGGALLLAEVSSGAPPGNRPAVRVPQSTEPAPVPAMLAATDARGAQLDAKTPAQAREILAFTHSASARDVPTLRAMALRSENALVAGNALRALGRLGEVAGDHALLALLRDPRLRVRQELVHALGASGAPEAVELLADAAVGDEATLRPLALTALGRIGTARARIVLEQVRDDPTAAETERVFARQALGLDR